MAMPSEPVTIIDLRIPFFRLVFFFVKAALAAIPAAIILAIVTTVITAIIGALAGGGVHVFMHRWTM